MISLIAKAKQEKIMKLIFVCYYLFVYTVSISPVADL